MNGFRASLAGLFLGTVAATASAHADNNETLLSVAPNDIAQALQATCPSTILTQSDEDQRACWDTILDQSHNVAQHLAGAINDNSTLTEEQSSEAQQLLGLCYSTFARVSSLGLGDNSTEQNVNRFYSVSGSAICQRYIESAADVTGIDDYAEQAQIIDDMRQCLFDARSCDYEDPFFDLVR